MKKTILSFFVAFACVLLVGCGSKESNDIKLCDKIEPIQKKYENDTKTMVDKLTEVYNEFCPDEENDACKRLDSSLKDWKKSYDVNKQTSETTDNAFQAKIISILMDCSEKKNK